MKKNGEIEIFLTDRVAKKLAHAWRESNLLEKELGGVMCYKPTSRGIEVDDVIQLNQFMLQSHEYRYNSDAVVIASEFRCSNRDPITFHTHPSGNASPSRSDRQASARTGWTGCAVGKSGVKCYLGNKDVKVLPSQHI